MKKVFLGVLSFTFVFNMVIPFIYYKLFGFEYVYYAVEEKYVNYAFWFLTAAMLMACIALSLSKNDNRKIDFAEIDSDMLEDSTITGMFMCSLLVNLYTALRFAFSDVVTGGVEGTLVSYLQIFLDVRLLFFFALVQAYKRKKTSLVITYSLLYTVVSLMQASRSALFWVVMFNLIFIYSTKVSRNMKRNIIAVVIAAALLAPLAFIFATSLRYGAGKSISYYLNLIIGRLSYLEIAGIELERFVNEAYVEDLFIDKYSLVNQLEQLINTVIPGNLFEYDVYPNQYWRAIFAGWNIEAIAANYTSMYMIMPIYLLVKYGYIAGVLGFVLIIMVLYSLIRRIKNNSFAFFLSTYFLYVVIQFFDWTYHFRDLLCFGCTLIAIKMVSKVRRKIKIRLR